MFKAFICVCKGAAVVAWFSPSATLAQTADGCLMTMMLLVAIAHFLNGDSVVVPLVFMVLAGAKLFLSLESSAMHRKTSGSTMKIKAANTRTSTSTMKTKAKKTL